MVKFCPECGSPVPLETSKFCDPCGTKLAAAVLNEQSTSGQTPPVPDIAEEKNPGLAALCSFFIPGLGQVYNGETAKGVAVFFGTLIGFFIFFIPGLAVWIVGMIDAYSTAKKMNLGEISFKPTKTAHLILFFLLVMFIVALVVIFAILAAFATFFAVVTHS